MNYIYVVFLETWWSDLDNHYGNDVIGFFSSLKKAKKYLDKFLEDHTDPDNGIVHIVFADEWTLYIDKIPLDNFEDPSNGETVFKISSLDDEEEEEKE